MRTMKGNEHQNSQMGSCLNNTRSNRNPGEEAVNGYHNTHLNTHKEVYHYKS